MELETAHNIVYDINTYYSFNSIYKSLIICNNDDDVNLLAKLMRDDLYSVYTITASQLEDINNTSPRRVQQYITDLIKFNNQEYRVIIVGFYVWTQINTQLELYVLPEQNLIVLPLLDEEYMKSVSNWIYDTMNRGFITRPDSYVLKIIDENDINITYSKKKYTQSLIQLTETTEIRKNKNKNININRQPEYVF